jgi:hypothetical protein
MPIQQRLRKSDILWLLAFPLYEIIGTARHEGSHALVALIEGAKIEQFVILPSIKSYQALLEGRILWGYVVWSGPTDWVPVAAPYLCDLLTYLVFFFVCTRLSFRRHWAWVNLIIVGLISPLVNSGYQYVIAFIGRGTDIPWLLNALPPLAIHVYFAVTLALYVLGLLAILLFPSHILVGKRMTR